MTPRKPRPATEQHVLAVLTGTPLEQAAAQIPMDSSDLVDAVQLYRAAGRAALEAQTHAHNWYQVRIQFPDWNTAEQAAAAHLGPRLAQAQNTGMLTDWWFLRKHPYWRLRCRPSPTTATGEMAAAIGALLDTLTADGTIQRWRSSIYEPEALTFGGPTGMDIAHTLFHADSLGVLSYLRHQDPAAQPEQTAGRREITVLLCTALFRAARQDRNEQSDIWHRVAHLRPLATEPPHDQLRAMTPGLRRLMSLDTTLTGTLFGPGGPLGFAGAWLQAFTAAGRHLADAARDGTLDRGLRDTLAHHVIFHFNRLGLPAGTQAVLARASRETLINPSTDTTGA